MIFESLIAKIDQNYGSCHEILTRNGLLSAVWGHRATSVRPATCEGGGESVCVELLDAKTMPFEVSATCSAAWRCITSGYMQLQHEVYRVRHQPTLLGALSGTIQAVQYTALRLICVLFENRDMKARAISSRLSMR